MMDVKVKEAKDEGRRGEVKVKDKGDECRMIKMKGDIPTESEGLRVKGARGEGEH